MRTVLAAAVLQLAVLTGCSPPEEPADEPAPDVAAVDEVARPAVPPIVHTVIQVREAVQEQTMGRVPQESMEDMEYEESPAFRDCAIRLITKWEVGGIALYTRKWQHVYYPGGASGPTWGIGYDGGHQTRYDILSDWADHTDKDRLATTSGVAGSAARQRIKEWAGVNTPYSYAAEVFVQTSLRKYTATARRAFGPSFVSLPDGARCALVSLVYNRGGQMTGDRRKEMRVIRDECTDAPCVSEQLLAMRRLWPDTPGLRSRREDEARIALT